MTNTTFPPPTAGSAAPGPPPTPTPSPGPAPRKEPEPRSAGAAVLVAVGVVAVLVLFAVAALPVLSGGGSDDPASDDAATPADDPATSALELRPQPTAPPEEAPSASVEVDAGVGGEATPAPEADVGTPAAGDAPAEAPAVDPAAEQPAAEVAVEVAPAEPPVPESKAVVRGGQIFLEGAVPTAEAGEAIAALAAEILGPDNVFNNYVVDPRAGDPNLGNVTVEDTINFASGSSVILPEGEGLLNQALALMTIRPSVTVTIVGHTDSRGSEEYNQTLSEQRAEAVKAWLTDRGIDGTRLTVVGKGESEPIAPNDTAEGQRLNRRIQFFIENLLADS